jgi:hypothetical protein
MSKADGQSQPKPPGRERKLLILVALVTAAGGFVSGMAGAALVAAPGETTTSPVVRVDVGTFPLAMPGVELQFVDVSVSIDPGSAPDGPALLRDAVGTLLAEAAVLPLVQDGRTTLTELEKTIMAMAPVSAPWLASVDLEPTNGLSTAALSTKPAEQRGVRF